MLGTAIIKNVVIMTVPRPKQKILLIAQNIPQVYVALALLPKLDAQFADSKIVVLTRAKHFQHFESDAIFCKGKSKPFLIDEWPVREEMTGFSLVLCIGHSYFLSEELLHHLTHVDCPVYWINAHFEQADLIRWCQRKLVITDIFLGVFYENHEDRQVLSETGFSDQQLHFVGSAKFDCAAASLWQIAHARTSLNAIQMNGHAENSITLVAASIAEIKEMALIVNAYHALTLQHPNLFLILAPRSLERIEEFGNWMEQRNFHYHRSSGSHCTPCPILLVDEVGILKGYYYSADIAIMGRSFYASSGGGSNLLEPAAAALPIVCGPYMDGFKAITSLFLQQQAVLQLSTPEQLLACLRQLLGNPSVSTGYGDKAKSLLQKHTGALESTVRQLGEMCDALGPDAHLPLVSV
ncbi:3-deoxy-D-manno-octulosonic acid transferase [Undibacterium sp. Di26W]|uniref:3-deoxy-D-manno-octulosonic acid transferase n=1 Tax=Undibacterium sp. Di26W TaxID=3413035 RepID=UPI003BF2C176